MRDVPLSLRLPLILFLIATPPLHAQILPTHFYTLSDGLPSNRISALCQDSRGFLWIGTDEGLVVYDGVAFRTYTTLDGLPNSYITSIFESRKTPGTMWLATIVGGLTKYEDGTFTTFRFGSAFSRNSIGSIIEDEAGIAWCITAKGVFKTDGDSLRYAPLIPTEYINGDDIIRTHDDSIWIGVNRHVYILSSAGTVSRTIDLTIAPNAYILRMMEDREGDVWVSSSDSTVSQFVKGRLFASWRAGAHGRINQMILDRDGDLWMTMARGLLRTPKKAFRNGHPTSYDLTKNPGEFFHQLLEDREGIIWLGGYASGLCKVSEKNVMKFALTNEGWGGTDRAGHLWLRNHDGLWECWRDAGGAWLTYHHPVVSGNWKSQVGAILSDVHGRLWRQFSDSTLVCDTVVHHEKGPSTLRPLYTLRPGRDFPVDFLWMYYVCSRNFLWLSLASGIGVVDLNGPRPKFVTLLRFPDQMAVSSVRTIFRDVKGNVWFGGFGDGLAELVDGDLILKEIRHFTARDGLADNGVRSLAEDDHGRLWIGTRFGGVAIYDGVAFRTISMKDGLPSNAVWSLGKDDQHRMWLGTGAGAVSASMENLRDLRWSRGVAREACGVCVSHVTKTVWIVNAKEAIALEDDTRSTIPPPVYILRVAVNDRPVVIRDGLQFPYDQNNCVIEFVGISLRDELAVQYQYRLRGIDNEWSVPSRRRSVAYASLSPGSYAFEVKAMNADGIASESPASFSFIIIPPLWRRWWFESLAVGAIAALAYAGVRRKMRALEKSRALQEEFSRRLIESQESERKRIAAELHDGLGQNLLIIKNQALLGLDSEGHRDQLIGQLQDISTLASQTITDVRNIAHNLRPYLLDKLGLTKGVQSMLRKISESSGMTFSTDIETIDGFFSKEGEVHIYRIVQECLNNIVRHAGATSASVSIIRTAASLAINVTDKGKGFNTASVSSVHGFGLSGMTERVRILGGSVTIESTPGKGTSVDVRIPLTEGTYVR